MKQNFPKTKLRKEPARDSGPKELLNDEVWRKAVADLEKRLRVT